MQEAIQQPTTFTEASDPLAAAAYRAEAWAGEPFLRDGEDPAQALAPGTARRRALDEAIAEIGEGNRSPSPQWKVRFGFMLGLERVLAEPEPRTKSGTALRRHQVDALAGMLTELIAASQRDEENGNGHALSADELAEIDEEAADEDETLVVSTEDAEDEEPEELSPEQDPGAVRRYRFRHPTASGKTIAAAGFVEAARTLGVLILTHRRLLVSQFHARPDDGGLRGPLHRRDRARQGARAHEPADDPDVRVVRAPRRLDQPRRVPARHLRRGAHRARREDVRGDPLLPGAHLHRHDGDGAAHREAGLRRLPGVGRRPAAPGRRAARVDRAAALPARAAGRRDQLRADRRRRLRPGDPRQDPRPPGVEPGGGEPLPRPLRQHAGHRLRGRRRARVQPRAGVPRHRHQGRGSVGAHAAGAPRRDARGVRARRDQRAHQRAAARRGLELAARDRVHASRADGVAPRLPAAHRPHHAHAPAQGSRHRRRLRPEGRDAQRARRVAALAARRRLLPRGRARHARAAAPLAAPRTPPPHAGAVARPGHAGRAAGASPSSSASGSASTRASSTTTSSATGRRSPAARSASTSARRSSRSSPKGARARARSSSSSPRAQPRTRTAGCA